MSKNYQTAANKPPM